MEDTPLAVYLFVFLSQPHLPEVRLTTCSIDAEAGCLYCKAYVKSKKACKAPGRTEARRTDTLEFTFNPTNIKAKRYLIKLGRRRVLFYHIFLRISHPSVRGVGCWLNVLSCFVLSTLCAQQGGKKDVDASSRRSTPGIDASTRRELEHYLVAWGARLGWRNPFASCRLLECLAWSKSSML